MPEKENKDTKPEAGSSSSDWRPYPGGLAEEDKVFEEWLNELNRIEKELGLGNEFLAHFRKMPSRTIY